MKKLLLLLIPVFFIFACNNAETENTDKQNENTEETVVNSDHSGCPHAGEHHEAHAGCPHAKGEEAHTGCVHAKSDTEKSKCCNGKDHEKCCQQTGEPCEHHKKS